MEHASRKGCSGHCGVVLYGKRKAFAARPAFHRRTRKSPRPFFPKSLDENRRRFRFTWYLFVFLGVLVGG